jgi:DNA-directed RNA polymerase specialized sigma24 family protein
MTVRPMTDIMRIKRRARLVRRDPRLTGDRESMFVDDRRERRQLAGGPAGAGGTQTPQIGENGYMSAGPAHTSAPHPDAGTPGGNGSASPAPRLDPAADFERYREPASRRFVAMARAMGMHSFHDLDELAKDFYDDFWAEWLERPRRELTGAPVPYIAGAMMNKLRDLSRRGRSVRAPDFVRSEGDAILATVAAEDLEPAEQLVLQEEMWLVSEIVHTLPAREQVVFAAVFGRDSKRKDAPAGGYKLAASQLGVSEARAKKLSLAANRRIRAAVAEIESGSWCDRWASSIELVAAGEEGEAEFLHHAEHCVQCRLGVVHLRRQAAILPLPVAALGQHAGLVGRVWGQVRAGARTVRDQLAAVFGRHGTAANDASGLVSSGGGAAGAGVTALKVGAVCLGVGLTGGAASVCLRVAGLPSPIIAAMSSSARHARVHRPVHHPVLHIQLARPPIPPAIPPGAMTSAVATVAPRAASHAHRSGEGSAGARSAAQRSATAAETEFNPGGGSGSQVSTSGSEAPPAGEDHSARAAAADPSTAKPVSQRSSASPSGGGGGGTVTSGSSNEFTAP